MDAKMSTESASWGKGGNFRGRMACWISPATARSFLMDSSWLCSFCDSRTKLICSMAFSMVRERSSRSMGLVAKSKAPLFMAERILSMSPYADTMMHFSAGFLISLMRVSKVSPSISGMLMSLRMMSKFFFSSISCNASNPLCAKVNSYSPLRIFLRKYWVSSISRSCSSSTLKIFIAIVLYLIQYLFLIYYHFSSSAFFGRVWANANTMKPITTVVMADTTKRIRLAPSVMPLTNRSV